jgi:succinyl-diaminopimelate desuccinylase
MDQAIEKLHRWIDEHQSEIVETLQGVLRIPSVEGPPEPNAPYGRAVREALDYTLELSRKLGFRVRDIDGHAGDAEFGEGSEYIGVLGHLDVVPEGDGWHHPPYGAEIEDGYIYARGASDDKGPTYAALYAAKALMESGLPLRRRVRIIFGCNEESGFGCMHHYFDVTKQERPLYGFTPDASFPLIYAEKGIVNLTLSKPLPKNNTGLYIAHAQGGRRPNMVPDHASALLAGSDEALHKAETLLRPYWDRNITFSHTDGGIKIEAIGKSAHGSHPTAGDNAIVRLARVLCELELPERSLWLDWVVHASDTAGSGLGIAHRDDVSGPLTSNLGVLEYKEERVSLTYNIRYPVTWPLDSLLAQGRPFWEKEGWTYEVTQGHAPLYVPLDQEPVATLLRVYREETGDTKSQPGTMGGGTYARATPRTVAYGAAFPDGKDGPAHEPDERIAIQSVLKAAKIYAHALYELAK